MGVSLNRPLRHPRRRQRGFSLLEQIIATGVIVIGSVCALESIAFCLITLQVSEKKWEENLCLWNEEQLELSEQEETNESSEELEKTSEP